MNKLTLDVDLKVTSETLMPKMTIHGEGITINVHPHSWINGQSKRYFSYDEVLQILNSQPQETAKEPEETEEPEEKQSCVVCGNREACPWCGGYKIVYSSEKHNHKVYCSDCGQGIVLLKNDSYNKRKTTREDAVRKWNIRFDGYENPSRKNEKYLQGMYCYSVVGKYYYPKEEPLSKEVLLSRGECCHNGCQNCPYPEEKTNG